MKIIFAIPGFQFSNNFLSCWTNLIKYLEKNNIEWELLTYYSPIVHHTRKKIVDYLLSDNEKFNNYDRIMWIDDDIFFTHYQFEKLLSHDVDIVSGLYYSHSIDFEKEEREYACVGLNGKRLLESDLENQPKYSNDSDLIRVYSNGLGWMLVKNGVFESLLDNRWKDPFLSEKLLESKKGNVCIVEDLAFQQNALEKGFKSYVDPSIVVGHEKLIQLEKFKGF